MIGMKKDLDGCEKYAYLKGQLKDEPLTMVSHLTIENESYDAAWKLLDQRYDNKHTIITKLLDRIINLEVMTKNSVDSMTHTVNIVSECFTTLLNMGM